MKPDDDIIDKIEKLLRLAGSSNEHEAALAMAKAMELADKHAIDIGRVAKHAGAAKFVLESLQEGRKLSLEADLAGCVCAEFFHVEYILKRRRQALHSTVKIEFFGEEQHIGIARYVHAFLVRAARDCYRGKMHDRSLWMHSFFNGVRVKLTRDRDAQPQSFALMIVDQQAERNERLKAVMPDLTTHTVKLPKEALAPRTKSARETVRDGFNAGLKTKLRPALGKDLEPQMELAFA